MTRQTAHQAVHGLVALGLLEQVPDPASARTRLIRITPEGERVHARAQAVLARVEEVPAERIGAGPAAAPRAALSLPRGEPPLVRAPWTTTSADSEVRAGNGGPTASLRAWWITARPS
ncbi:hypothetical protein [Streptomyces sp. NPDC014006]|uniref:hypothetical protein n=1 Tax=Streptomyces sp. NPDC014006 TaxID=3364870 RepID=UPI0036FCD453